MELRCSSHTINHVATNPATVASTTAVDVSLEDMPIQHVESYSGLNKVILAIYRYLFDYEMNLLPAVSAATTVTSPPIRKRNTVNRRHAVPSGEDYDPFLGMTNRQLTGSSMSQSISLSMPLSIPVASPISSPHMITNKPIVSMSLPMAMSPSLPISPPLMSIPTPAMAMTEVPTSTYNSPSDETNAGLQIGLIIALVAIIGACITVIIYYRRQHIVQEGRRSNQSDEIGSVSAVERDAESSSSAFVVERDPESDGSVPATERDRPESDVGQKQSPLQKISTWQSSASSLEPLFVPAHSDDSAQTDDVHMDDGPMDEECHATEEDLPEVVNGTLDASEESDKFYDAGHGIDQDGTNENKQTDDSSNPSKASGQPGNNIDKYDIADNGDGTNSSNQASEMLDATQLDLADPTNDTISFISEVSKMERLVLREILGDSNKETKEETDRTDNDKWRNEFRNDINNMCYIHQQMLDQQAMQHAPDVIKNEYYETVYRIAVERAELELKKIELNKMELENKRAELELKRLDLELMKVDKEKKIWISNVSNDVERKEVGVDTSPL